MFLDFPCALNTVPPVLLGNKFQKTQMDASSITGIKVCMTLKIKGYLRDVRVAQAGLETQQSCCFQEGSVQLEEA